MNITLSYQGINYNFDLRKDINIKYIHDLASRLISKDSSSFELLYKNKTLSQYENTTLMKDLIKDDKNICIIISQKYKNAMNDENKRIRKIKDLEKSRNSSKNNDLQIMITTPSITKVSSKSMNINQNFNQFRNKRKSPEYISENKVFEDIYNLKENEIFSLMNNLSRKIKEYDDILYKKYKNNFNNKLSSYEKIIIDYKDKQITFLKKLNEYLSNEQDFLSGEIQLDEFYNELKQYNNQKNIIIYNNDNIINNSFKSLNRNLKK